MPDHRPNPASLLLGCASTGDNLHASKISQIQKGATTEAELIQLFGEPKNRTVTSEGQADLTWQDNAARVKGKSIIPDAALFMGGTRSKTKSLLVTLRDGKVVSYSLSSGNIESRGTTQDVPK